MFKVTGVGGVFLYSNDPRTLAGWYTRNLGLDLTYDESSQNYYLGFFCRDPADPSRQLQTVFAIMPAPEKLRPGRGEYMINYRVDDLDGLVAQLAAAGVSTEPVTLQADGQGQGKFTQLKDPEGNRIELWQHLD